MDHYLAIGAALHHLEQQLFAPLDLNVLSRKANMSRFHFQRTFRYVVGCPVTHYLQQRRLYLAAQALQDSRQNILTIALAHGFNSGETFCRAFVRQYGCPPQAFRQAPFPLAAFLPPDLELRRLQLATEGAISACDTVTLPAIQLLGLQTILCGQQDEAVIHQIWTELLAMQAELTGLQAPHRHFNLLGEGFLMAPYLYYAALQTQELIPVCARLSYRLLPAGRYIRLIHQAATHQGFADNLDQALALIHARWLASHDVTLAETGFELMVITDENAFSQDATLANLELYLPIE